MPLGAKPAVLLGGDDLGRIASGLEHRDVVAPERPVRVDRIRASLYVPTSQSTTGDYRRQVLS